VQKIENQSNKYEDLLPQLIPQDIPSALSWWNQTSTNSDQVPIYLPAFTFSRYGNPSPYLLCPDIEHRDEAKMKAGKDALGQNMRVERKTYTLALKAGDHFPDAPSQEGRRMRNSMQKSRATQDYR